MAPTSSSNVGSVLRSVRRSGTVLLVCHDGGLVSSTVSAILSLAHREPVILAGGWAAYRDYVDRLLHSQGSQEAGWVTRLRYIVITGPQDGGREDIVSQLHRQKAQILNLEEFTQETTTTTTTQSKFESRVCFALRWRLNADKEQKLQQQ